MKQPGVPGHESKNMHLAQESAKLKEDPLEGRAVADMATVLLHTNEEASREATQVLDMKEVLLQFHPPNLPKIPSHGPSSSKTYRKGNFEECGSRESN